jgi:hypothetical protein
MDEWPYASVLRSLEIPACGYNRLSAIIGFPNPQLRDDASGLRGTRLLDTDECGNGGLIRPRSRQLEMQPQQPGSIAHLTENRALSIKNTTDRSIRYRKHSAQNDIPPQRDQGYAAANQYVP